MNSKEVVRAKVFPGAAGILSSANRQSILERAVRQSRRGGLVAEGWTGMLRNADLMSSLDIKHP